MINYFIYAVSETNTSRVGLGKKLGLWAVMVSKQATQPLTIL